MDINKLFQSKVFIKTLIVVGIIIIALLILQVGIWVGYHKASFSYGWGENYHRNFGGPRGGFIGNTMERFGMMRDQDFTNPNGVYGKIIKIDSSSFSVESSDNAEKTVLISESTSIVRFREHISIKDLRVGDYVVVVGEPNDKGQIEAILVRVMPESPLPMRNGSTSVSVD